MDAAVVEALRDLTSDVRYAVRALAKNPAFSLTVIGVLALGIGLNAAVFTMLKSMALSPVAGVEHSSHLTVVFRETPARRALRVSYPDYRFLRDNDRAFSGLMGTTVAQVGLGRDKGSRSLWGEIVTGNYFQVLGVRAQIGRTLLPSDEIAPGGHPVAVISDGLWRRDFAGDPGIVGQTVEINNTPLTIVGVTDPAFHGTMVSYDVEVFIPVMMAPQLGFSLGSQKTTAPEIFADPRAEFFYPQGFLRPGTTRAAAAAQADALWATRAPERPVADTGEKLRVVPFWQSPGSAQTYLMPTLIVLSRDGAPRSRDRLRQHRRPGAGARHVAARRDRDATRSRRQPHAHRPPAGCRESGPRAARRRTRHPGRCERPADPRGPTPRRSPRRSACS